MERINRTTVSRLGHVLVATGLFLVIVMLTKWLSGQEPATRTSIFNAALVSAAGTMAMAWLRRRHSAFQPWAIFGLAGVLGAAILLSTVTISTPQAWVQDVREELWLYPWFVLIMSILAPQGAQVRCSPASSLAGGFLIFIGVVLGAFIVFSEPIHAFLRGGFGFLS